MNISLRTSIAFAAIALICSFWMGLYSRLEPVALTTTGLFILLLWVLATKPISFKQAGVGGAAFSLLFALFMVLGYHIQITGNTYQGAAAENFISPYTFADGVAFVAIAGGTYVLSAAFLTFVRTRPEGACGGLRDVVGRGAVSRRWVAGGALFLFGCWLPYLLTWWPGLIFNDSITSLEQVLGLQAWSNRFPVAYTAFIALCVRAASLVGLGVSAGCGLYSVLQMVCLALCLSYMANWMVVRGRLGRIWLLALLGIFGFSSYIASFSIAMWKDPLFAVGVVLLALRLFDYAWGIAYAGRGWVAKTAALMVLIALVRSNGVFVDGVILVVLIVVAVRAGSWRSRHVRLAGATALAVGLAVVVTGPGYTVLGVGTVPRAESLGLPINQMSRVVALGGAVSEEDAAYMDRLLPLEEYRNVYVPTCVDGVKWSADFSDEVLEEGWVRHWLSVGAQNPRAFFEAWDMLTFGFWAVNSEDANFYFDNISGGVPANVNADGTARLDDLGIHGRNLTGVAEASQWFPLRGWWLPLSWIHWTMLFLLVCLWRTRDRASLLGLAPALGVAFTLIAASPIWYWPRYGAPEQLLVPVFVMLFVMVIRSKRETARRTC